MMKFLCFSLLFIALQTIAQTDTTYQRNIPETGGLVAYYIWEEDTVGNIISNSYSQPFLQNFIITKTPFKTAFFSTEDLITSEQLKQILMQFAHDYTKNSVAENFKLLENGIENKYKFSLERKLADKRTTVCFVLKNGEWTSSIQQNVLYFKSGKKGNHHFLYAEDTIRVKQFKVPSNGHYIMQTKIKQKGVKHTKVYAYNGINVTATITKHNTVIPQRYLVFANGYRGPSKNKDVTDHLVTKRDRYHYWYKIDNKFIERLQPDESFYIDGSMPLNTSSHRSKLRFGWSMLRASKIFRRRSAKKRYKIFNTSLNKKGFQERKEKGEIAALTFLNTIHNSPTTTETIDTLDIVCHSMGYAYALGFIEALKGKIVFGKFYILAPESACADGTDWGIFSEVWQYGSNLDQPDADPISEQDGIAPQCGVKGIEKLPSHTKGGRLFIPKDWPNKNFIDSHQLYNFYWIFERINEGETGYIN